MAYDYSKLNGKITQLFNTQCSFASAMNLSQRSLSLKLNNHLNWKQSEIVKACELLHIEESEIGDYFFARIVQCS